MAPLIRDLILASAFASGFASGFACATFDPKSCLLPHELARRPSCSSRADIGRTAFHWDHQDVCMVVGGDAKPIDWSCPYKEGTLP